MSNVDFIITTTAEILSPYWEEIYIKHDHGFSGRVVMFLTELSDFFLAGSRLTLWLLLALVVCTPICYARKSVRQLRTELENVRTRFTDMETKNISMIEAWGDMRDSWMRFNTTVAEPQKFMEFFEGIVTAYLKRNLYVRYIEPPVDYSYDHSRAQRRASGDDSECIKLDMEEESLREVASRNLSHDMTVNKDFHAFGDMLRLFLTFDVDNEDAQTLMTMPANYGRVTNALPLNSKSHGSVGLGMRSIATSSFRTSLRNRTIQMENVTVSSETKQSPSQQSKKIACGETANADRLDDSPSTRVVNTATCINVVNAHPRPERCDPYNARIRRNASPLRGVASDTFRGSKNNELNDSCDPYGGQRLVGSDCSEIRKIPEASARKFSGEDDRKASYDTPQQFNIDAQPSSGTGSLCPATNVESTRKIARAHSLRKQTTNDVILDLANEKPAPQGRKANAIGYDALFYSLRRAPAETV